MSDLAASIDHTLLRADATRAQIEQLCGEALDLGFAAVCVNPLWVEHCARRLTGSAVRVCAVVGFPLGAHLTEVKALEARRAAEQGAGELDVVIQIGLLAGGEEDRVEEDLRAVIEAARGATVKAILETSLLPRDAIVRAARRAAAAGAHFVKTGTGFGPRGATVEDVVLLRGAVGPAVGVKAAGGIRTRAHAISLIEAGASRLGTSAGVEIVRGAKDPNAAGWP